MDMIFNDSIYEEGKEKFDVGQDDLIKKYEGVVGVYTMTNSEICLKYKNPSFKFYELSQRGFGLMTRWDPKNKLLRLPEEIEEMVGEISPMMNPVLYRIHSSPNKSFDESSVFLIAYTPRFFHFMLEHLPKIFFLKEKDPKFKLLLFSNENKNSDQIFSGLAGSQEHGREDDGSAFKFWLDLLEIDYRCFSLEDLSDINLDFDYAYTFYEIPFMKNHNGVDAYDAVILNGSPIHKDGEEYFTSITLDRGNLEIDGQTIDWLRPRIVNAVESAVKVYEPSKKIYISRKNYSRVNPNEIKIEQHFLSNGYQSVCMEDLNPIEQIKLVRECTDIVCYLGSSIVNLYYGKPDTRVTILGSKKEHEWLKGMNHYYSSILKNNGMKVSSVLVPEEIEGDVSEALTNIVGDTYGI
jgi:hypothetical protein